MSGQPLLLPFLEPWQSGYKQGFLLMVGEDKRVFVMLSLKKNKHLFVLGKRKGVNRLS